MSECPLVRDPSTLELEAEVANSLAKDEQNLKVGASIVDDSSVDDSYIEHLCVWYSSIR